MLWKKESASLAPIVYEKKNSSSSISEIDSIDLHNESYSLYRASFHIHLLHNVYIYIIA